MTVELLISELQKFDKKLHCNVLENESIREIKEIRIGVSHFFTENPPKSEEHKFVLIIT
jgi:hypothetical protein